MKKAYLGIDIASISTKGVVIDENNNKKQVLDPRNNNDISDCSITITKNIGEKYKVTYTITSASPDNENCPKKYGSVE